LVLIGEGPERSSIEAQVRQRQLEPYFRLLGLHTDVARFLPAADVFLLTSISEGIPLTVIEAMAAGLPVVATRVGGAGEIVEDGQTGLLARAQDDRTLSARVVRPAASLELRQQIGQIGRARAQVLFSGSRMHERYFQLYSEMLQSSQVKPKSAQPARLRRRLGPPPVQLPTSDPQPSGSLRGLLGEYHRHAQASVRSGHPAARLQQAFAVAGSRTADRATAVGVARSQPPDVAAVHHRVRPLAESVVAVRESASSRPVVPRAAGGRDDPSADG
jgi:hypothetical protein